ncbi:MAG: NAD-dependent epimerase/dehydratase family protein, partial [Pseudomonadota bacterium]|nr:NAD-dependent epimerase/dehydratase family protein [Pseudomonadota bacterium]
MTQEKHFDLTGKRVYVAGHTGLVGKALVRALEQRDVTVVKATKAELDLRDQAKTNAFMAEEKPDVVLLAAAKVGGIEANRTLPVDFLYD